MSEYASLPARLASVFERADRGFRENEVFSDQLTAAQSGAALRLVEKGLINLHGRASADVCAARSVVIEARLSDPRIGGDGPIVLSDSEFGRAFDAPPGDSRAEILCGYWAADFYLSKETEEDALQLTEFLIGERLLVRPSQLTNVRRYPSGGISEKQALLLPPLLRALSEQAGWRSAFLIARKLAHTGGTRDKLEILPGFSPVEGRRLSEWDGCKVPVIYFSADSRFCPRDEKMYRIRGETGTVANIALMAASIMAKQISCPADIVILDILHGDGAFIKELEHAERFAQLCKRIGDLYGASVKPMLRRSNGSGGRSVGVSTEVVEALEIISGKATYSSAMSELAETKRFLSVFAEQLNLEEDMSQRVDFAIQSGEALRSMLELWADHGVDSEFIRDIRKDVRKTLLAGLSEEVLRSSASGTIIWDMKRLADFVNEVVNCSPSSISGSVPVARGGVRMLVDSGAYIEAGEEIAIFYYQGGRDLPSCESLYRIERI